MGLNKARFFTSEQMGVENAGTLVQTLRKLMWLVLSGWNVSSGGGGRGGW